MKVQVIFPKDESTDFLHPIVGSISSKCNLFSHQLENKQDHFDIFKKVSEFEKDDLVLFLGHGTSTSLSGANTQDLNFGPVISEDQLKIFSNKRVFLLSCRSSEFLKKFGNKSGLKAGIGFPNMITDPSELEYPEDPDEVGGISPEHIHEFRDVIVKVISDSLGDFLEHELPFNGLYQRIKIRTTRELFTVNQDQFDQEETPISRMIRSLRDGMFFFGN